MIECVGGGVGFGGGLVCDCVFGWGSVVVVVVWDL